MLTLLDPAVAAATLHVAQGDLLPGQGCDHGVPGISGLLRAPSTDYAISLRESANDGAG